MPRLADPTARTSFDDLDWAMLEMRGPLATDAARACRRSRGQHVAHQARARFARRYYGQRWRRVGRARGQYVATRRRVALVEAMAALLEAPARPQDRDEARRWVEATIQRALMAERRA